MDSRTYIILVLLMVIGSAYADVRTMKTINRMDATVGQKRSSEIFENDIFRNEQLCTLCEQFTTEAIDYIGENETQTRIINTLHGACSRLHSSQKQCTSLVDYYAPFFFAETAMIHPEEFCGKVNLCQKTSPANLLKPDDACEICHEAVVQILLKLKDPETQLEIIHLLLKGCSKVEGFAKECKRLVFEYGPLILINLEGFMEKTDICTTIHACKASKVAVESQEFLAAS